MLGVSSAPSSRRHVPVLCLTFGILLRGGGCSGGDLWGKWTPNSKGFVTTMNRLEAQVKRMSTQQHRFDGLMNLAAAGLLMPNFTKRGWDVVQQPEFVRKKLYDHLHAGLEKAGSEGKIDQISGPIPKFISLGRLSQEIAKDLQPVHEEWIGGAKLTPTIAYGLRVYQNNNSLTMHIDHHDTHVISSIVHVDRDVDEPWPIVITGYDGKTVEYDLKPGEMLFYESAKCIHGRPRPMKGRWYSSLFVHYRPVDMQVSTQQVIATVGERHGARLKPSPLIPRMEMVGTGFRHLDCLHGWCDLATEWPPIDDDGAASDPVGLAPAEYDEGKYADAHDESASDEQQYPGEMPTQVQAKFVNDYMDGVELYWISEKGDKQPSCEATIFKRGASCILNTWPGHVFEAWTSEHIFVERYVIPAARHTGTVTISISSPSSEL